MSTRKTRRARPVKTGPRPVYSKRPPVKAPRRVLAGAACFLLGVALALPLLAVLRPAATTQAAPVVKARAVQPAPGLGVYNGATVCRMDNPSHVACDNGYSGPPPRG